MTTLIDYGAGNIRSVENALEELGAPYRTTRDPEVVRKAGRIILPGVGHFRQMARALDEMAIREPIRERIRAGMPFFGICVGLQYLFESSEEAPESRGLGVFPGVIKRFQGEARIPHMGWNSLSVVRPSRLLQGLDGEPFTYFAHSYYAPTIGATTATCTYSCPYSAVIEQDNVYAVQFHPEKSGAVGLRVVGNFLNL